MQFPHSSMSTLRRGVLTNTSAAGVWDCWSGGVILNSAATLSPWKVSVAEHLDAEVRPGKVRAGGRRG